MLYLSKARSPGKKVTNEASLHKFSSTRMVPSLWLKVKVKSCLTLWDPMDCSLPGSSIHGILQARILEWVAIPSPGDLPDPETEAGSPALQTDTLLWATREAVVRVRIF